MTRNKLHWTILLIEALPVAVAAVYLLLTPRSTGILGGLEVVFLGALAIGWTVHAVFACAIVGWQSRKYELTKPRVALCHVISLFTLPALILAYYVFVQIFSAFEIRQQRVTVENHKLQKIESAHTRSLRSSLPAIPASPHVVFPKTPRAAEIITNKQKLEERHP